MVGTLAALTILGACRRADEPAHAPAATPQRGGAERSLGTADMTSRDFAREGCATSGCHARLTETRWVHGPTRNGACVLCHPTDRPLEEHAFLPALPADQACFACHAPDETATHVHAPYGGARCLDCHDPHGGDTKSLIVAESVDALCASCHEPTPTLSVHAPHADGDCLACHRPHASRHAGLLQLPETALCYGCHRPFREFLPEGAGVTGANLEVHAALLEAGCRPCHAPHGSDHAPLLRSSPRETCLQCHEHVLDGFEEAESVHGPFEGEAACVECHAPHSSRFPALLHDRGGDACLRCHDRPLDAGPGRVVPDLAARFDDAGFLHEPVRRGECLSCHDPHFSPEDALLRNARPAEADAPATDATSALCFDCHDRTLADRETSETTWFRDGDRNLHFVHLRDGDGGRSCGLCHDPHAGADRALLRETSPFGPGGWPMPLGFERTETGGTCTTACHEPKRYDRTRGD